MIMPRRDEVSTAGSAEENGEVADMADDEVKPPQAVDDGRFTVGTTVVDNAFIDSLLNARKLELLHDPEIVSLLNRAIQKRNS